MIELSPLNDFLKSLRRGGHLHQLEQAALPVLAGWHPWLAEHSLRVARYATRLAGVFPVPIHPDLAFQAGLLHDLGKLLLSPDVALGTALRSRDHVTQVRLHPVTGFRLLRAAAVQPAIYAAVLHHHESWDGTGYPLRLAGLAIPRIARLVAVADLFDLLTASPPWGQGLAPEAAAVWLASLAGIRLDPDIVHGGLPALTGSAVPIREAAACLRG